MLLAAMHVRFPNTCLLPRPCQRGLVEVLSKEPPAQADEIGPFHRTTLIGGETEPPYHSHVDHPDIVLLDLKMPNGSGNYILGKLKDNPHTKRLPVIVVTADTGAGVKRLMTSLGADGFVTKPINWTELFEAIGRCVRLPQQMLVDYHLPEQLTLQEI